MNPPDSCIYYNTTYCSPLTYDPANLSLSDKLVYRPTKTDLCVFTRKNAEERDIIAVHVDDLLITGTGDRGRLDALVSEPGEFYKLLMLQGRVLVAAE